MTNASWCFVLVLHNSANKTVSCLNSFIGLKQVIDDGALLEDIHRPLPLVMRDRIRESINQFFPVRNRKQNDVEFD